MKHYINNATRRMFMGRIMRKSENFLPLTKREKQMIIWFLKFQLASIFLFASLIYSLSHIMPYVYKDGQNGIKYRTEYINTAEANFEPLGLSVEEEIRLLSKQYGVNTEDALRIAQCESSMGVNLFNNQGSSAKGVYMFINQTWKDYCSGDVLNQTDNITCFMKVYPEHKNFWACK